MKLENAQRRKMESAVVKNREQYDAKQNQITR